MQTLSQGKYLTLCVAVAATCMVLFALWLFFPGLTAGNMLALGLMVAVAAAAPVLMPVRSAGFGVAMTVAALMLGAGVILNAWFYTAGLGGTPSDPVLVNNDSFRWWNNALYRLDPSSGADVHVSHGYYGYVLAGVLWVFGRTVGTALLWSMAWILGSLLMTGALAYRLTASRKVTVIGVVATAAVCYWLSMGTLILKDAMVFFAILTAAYAMAGPSRRFVALVAVSTVLLLVSRPSYILLLVVGVVLTHSRRRKLFSTVSAVVLCLVVWGIQSYAVMDTYRAVVEYSGEVSGFTYDAPNQVALERIIGHYPDLPAWKKILYLPLTAVVQFIIPFPWTYARDIPFGLTQFWCHMGFAWYVFGFVFVYYLVSRWRTYRSPLYRLSVWALLCWLVPCYMFAGTVSRYGLSFVAVMAPAVALTLYDNRRSRRFYLWLGAFCVVVAAVLVAAYHLQKSA